MRKRMAQTGETYQQAQSALSKIVPPHYLLPPDSDRPCVGRCESEFSLADRGGWDEGSMVACARCPGSVCVECGHAPVEEPLARCERCAAAIEGWQRAERLRARCASRRCVSRARAGTSDSEWASNICDACDEPICWCGDAPVENIGEWCDRGCDYYYDEDWADEQQRHELRQQFDYAVGLLVKLGGGTRRQVFARLHRVMQAKAADATIDQLHAGIEHAGTWERQLRAKNG